jgi:hypothetical protein
MVKVIFFCLAILLPALAVDPESEEGISFLAQNGMKVEDLISKFKINNIASEIVDYSKVLSCSTQDHAITKNGITNANRRWYKQQNGKVLIPIVIEEALTKQENDLFLAAMQEIQQTTCITFSVYSSGNQIRGYDYVGVTKSSSGCFSEGLGRLGKGRQQLNLQATDPRTGGTCMIKGIAVHELLHVVGFHHMQNTPDRDDYVTIMWNNMNQDANTKYQFQKLSTQEASAYGAPYDFGSIMHYGPKDFSRNGQDTIVAKRQGVSFGQRQRISNWDAFKVNAMHNCQA